MVGAAHAEHAAATMTVIRAGQRLVGSGSGLMRVAIANKVRILVVGLSGPNSWILSALTSSKKHRGER